MIQIGKILARDAVLQGVLCHAGESYNLHDPQSLAVAADLERTRILQAAETLRAAGLPWPTVSVGSTPTALSARSYQGITEVRAGVYMFFDLVQAASAYAPWQISRSVCLRR